MAREHNELVLTCLAAEIFISFWDISKNVEIFIFVTYSWSALVHCVLGPLQRMILTYSHNHHCYLIPLYEKILAFARSSFLLGNCAYIWLNSLVFWVLSKKTYSLIYDGTKYIFSRRPPFRKCHQQLDLGMYCLIAICVWWNLSDLINFVQLLNVLF